MLTCPSASLVHRGTVCEEVLLQQRFARLQRNAPMQTECSLRPMRTARLKRRHVNVDLVGEYRRRLADLLFVLRRGLLRRIAFVHVILRFGRAPLKSIFHTDQRSS